MEEGTCSGGGLQTRDYSTGGRMECPLCFYSEEPLPYSTLASYWPFVRWKTERTKEKRTGTRRIVTTLALTFSICIQKNKVLHEGDLITFTGTHDR